MNEEIERLRSIVSDLEKSIPRLIEGARQPLLEEIEELKRVNERLLFFIFPDQNTLETRRRCECHIITPCEACTQWAHNYLKNIPKPL